LSQPFLYCSSSHASEPSLVRYNSMSHGGGARSRGGGGGGNLFSTPEARIAESNRRLLEEQNTAKTSDLSDSIAKLKFLSIDINNEVASQNKLIGQMDGQMDTASSMLDDTIGKLGTMLESPDAKHMLYLIIFVVTAFVLLYTYFFKMPSDEEEGVARER